MKLSTLKDRVFVYLDKSPIVLKRRHFVALSVFFHINVIVPLFLELYFNKFEMQDVKSENIVFINFSTEVNTTKLPVNQKKSQKVDNSSTKNKNLKTQNKERKEPSQNEINNMKKDYEEKMSSRVALILEQNIDNYSNLYGDFMVEFNVNREGKIIGYKLLKEEDDEKANQELKDILSKLRKFDPIPKHYPKFQKYRFVIPLSIE